MSATTYTPGTESLAITSKPAPEQAPYGVALQVLKPEDATNAEARAAFTRKLGQLLAYLDNEPADTAAPAPAPTTPQAQPEP